MIVSYLLVEHFLVRNYFYSSCLLVIFYRGSLRGEAGGHTVISSENHMWPFAGVQKSHISNIQKNKGVAITGLFIELKPEKSLASPWVVLF